MIKRNLLLPIVVGVLTVAGLAGCTGAPSSSPSGSSAAAGKDAAASTALPTIPTGTGIIAGTKLTSCDTTGNTVTAKGTVKMPEDKKGDVVISVSWVNSKNSSVYTRGVTTLKGLAGGDAKDWTTTGTLPAKAESVSCVLGAVIPK